MQTQPMFIDKKNNIYMVGMISGRYANFKLCDKSWQIRFMSCLWETEQEAIAALSYKAGRMKWVKYKGNPLTPWGG